MPMSSTGRLGRTCRPGYIGTSCAPRRRSLSSSIWTGWCPAARAEPSAEADQRRGRSGSLRFRNITCSPTRPCSGWSNASGTVASTSKPSERHSRTATSFDLDDRVELDASVTGGTRPVDDVLAEGATDTAAGMPWIDHETGRGHMRPAAGPVRAHLGASENGRSVHRDDGAPRRGFHPPPASLFQRQILGERVRMRPAPRSRLKKG